MALNINYSKVSYLVTNFLTKDYSFNFKIYDESDIRVYKRHYTQPIDDVVDELTITTDFTVTIDGDNGGLISLVSNPSLNEYITILRHLPIDRTIDYTPNGGIYSADLNSDQDYQTYLIQDQRVFRHSSISLPKSATLALLDPNIYEVKPNGIIKFNPAGDGMVVDDSLTAEVGIVADNIDDVIIVADSIDNVNLTGNNITNVNTTGNNITNVNNVGTNIASVNTVSLNMTEVINVNDNIIDVNTVGTNIADVVSTGSNIVHVINTSNNIADIIATSTNETNINTVSSNITNVNSVGVNIGDVIITADNIAAVVIVADNIDAIEEAAGSTLLEVYNAHAEYLSAQSYAQQLHNVYVDLYTSNGDNTYTATPQVGEYSSLHYSAESDDVFTEFRSNYREAAGVNPSTGLFAGIQYFNTVSNEMRVYDGSIWQTPMKLINGLIAKEEYIATAGQTIFNAVYIVGYIEVYRNGAKLPTSDYTATNGTSITLASGADLNDDIIIESLSDYNEVIGTGYGWKDNIQPFSSAKGKGTAEPLWEDIGNGLYAYDFAVLDELFVIFHVNHDYAQGTDAYPHIHFLNDTVQTVGATVTWRINYSIAKGHSQGQSLTTIPTTTMDLTYTYTGTEVAGEHIIVECSDLDAFDLIEPDTVIMMEVILQSSTAVGKTFGLMADLHYLADRDYTPSKSPDFYI